MKKYILTLLCALTCICASAAISGEWKLHPTFDNSVTRVVDTPSRCYFMGYNQTLNPTISFKSAPDCSLFYLDKEGEEIVAAAQRHAMAGTAVRLIEYNPAKNYLAVVYDDQNIDLLFDSGEVRNIPALKNASMPGSKVVNFVSFDPKRDRMWVFTDFGYVAINDKKFEVAESRNYGSKFVCGAVVGNDLYLISDNATYIAPVADPRLNLTDYTIASDLDTAIGIYPLSDTRFLLNTVPQKNYNAFHVIDIENGVHSHFNDVKVYGPTSVSQAENGFMMTSESSTIYYDRDKKYSNYLARDAEDKGIYGASTWNQTEFFTVEPRKGLRSKKLNADKTYTLTRNYMLPNAPNAYYSRAMAYHPRYGMLVNSHPDDGVFNNQSVNEPILLSGLKNGLWTSLSPAYRYTEQTQTGYNPIGITIDPANDKYVWMGSNFSGMTRLNLDDPKDILHYSFPGDATASLPGYVEANPIINAWKRLCHFSQPLFDNNNTLWSFFCDNDDPDHIQFRYLSDADRKASTSAATAREWKKLKVPGVKFNILSMLTPLKASVNRNLLFNMNQDGLLVYDHNGTPENTSDDKMSYITTFTDQDGGVIDLYLPAVVYEDTQSGIVWIGNYSGIFYCQPKNILQGQAIINRVKVSRNDGTTLADYLLNGVSVNDITSDSSGRKWIATTGAGVVVTSADGRTIIDEFTSANSDIPSDKVYKLAYNPETRSVMVSTEKGLAEFFIGGNADSAASEETVRAYPNPVAPDYYGWVTIDGLPDDSLVKIVDSQGNLVRELGRAESGSIQWDVNNLYYKRVKTGVYYVLSSSASEGAKESNVAKILVMN